MKMREKRMIKNLGVLPSLWEVISNNQWESGMPGFEWAVKQLFNHNVFEDYWLENEYADTWRVVYDEKENIAYTFCED